MMRDAPYPARFVLAPVMAGAGVACWFAIAAADQRALLVAVLALAAGLLIGLRGGGLAAFCLMWMILGAGAIEARSRQVAAPVVQVQQRASLSGIVLEDSVRAEGGRRLLIAPDAARLPARVRLTDRIARAPLAPGTRVQVRAIIGPPPAAERQGGYDFARRDWFERIGAVGFTLAPVQVLAPPKGEMRTLFAAWRARIAARIGESLDADRAAVAAALLVGERSAIPEEWNAAARDSGIAHILSISGLHLVLVTGLVMGAVRAMLATVPFLAVRLPVKAIAAGVAGVAAIGYTLLSGAAPPTIRSCLVCLMVLAALAAGREPFSIRTLAFAALFVLAIRPEAVVDVSTQMSFAAVGGLIALAGSGFARRYLHRQPSDGWPHRLVRATLGLLAASLMCELMLAPIAFHQFGRTGLYGMLSNLLAVPLTSILVMPAGLLAMLAMPLGLEALPLKLMGLGIDALIWIARTVAAIPMAVLRIPSLPGPAFGLCAAALVWLVVIEHKLRWVAAPLIAGIILAAVLLARPPDIWISEGARLVALTRPDGLLAVADARGGRFARAQWLESLGQSEEAWAGPGGDADWSCAGGACRARALGVLPLLYLKSARAVGECADHAGLVIARFALLGRCPRAAARIDADMLEGTGGLTVALLPEEAGRLRLVMERISDGRGDFPWAAPGKPVQ